jgi:hypothetical protein
MECGAKFGAEGGEGEHGGLFKEDIRYLISDIGRRNSNGSRWRIITDRTG